MAASGASTVRTLPVPIIAALLVLVGGLLYAVAAPRDHRSAGRLLLAPAATTVSEEADLTYNYLATSVLGTWVEYVDSSRVRERAGRPDVDLTVRAGPETRVIDVWAVGDRDRVQPAVTAIMEAATRGDGGLDDAWSLKTLQPASPPESVGPGILSRVAVAVLLAVLAALSVVGFLGWSALERRPSTFSLRSHATPAP